VRAFVSRVLAQKPAPSPEVTEALEGVLAAAGEDILTALQHAVVVALKEQVSLRGWGIRRAPHTDQLHADLAIATLYFLADHGDDPRGPWWTRGAEHLAAARKLWRPLDGDTAPA